MAEGEHGWNEVGMGERAVGIGEGEIWMGNKKDTDRERKVRSWEEGREQEGSYKKGIF